MINPIETIRIYNPAGQAYYSDAAKTNIEFPVTNSCERSAKLMGDDYVRLVFKLPNNVVFDTYAFIEYDGQTFFLKETYRPTPNGCLKETIDGKESVSSAYYSYDVKFVSIANMLTKPICYRHVVVKGAGGTQQTWDEPEISINGTLETLYQIIIGSIQQAASRLSASHYKDMLTSIATNGAFTNGAKPNGVQLTPNTKLVTFSFSGDNIANVCTSVANAYTEDGKDTEWYITEDAKHSCTLHFAKCESADTAQVLSDYEWENNGTDRFARPYLNGGLKSVEYAQAWSDVPQVIVPYGADRNMSGISVVGIDETTQMQSTFGKRLRLDPNTTYNVHDKNGENTATITTDAHGAISNPNVNTGIEITKFYNDIYPQCHFKITKVEVKNKRQSGETVPEYTCEGIAVDARYTKEYLAQKGMFPLRIEEATTLSVRFESGFLNGREFEIANKTHKDQGSTGYSLKFTIVADGSIEDGTLIPSGNFKPNVGDQFALFNMKMPAEFVSLAKQDLAQRAYEELLDLQNTRPEVKCTAEPFTFMQHTVAFGAVVQVSSELFGDKPFVSRVIAYSYKLTSPSNVQFSLASAVMQGTLSEMNNAISDVTHTAGGLEQRAINLSRRGWRDANEVADMLDSITSEMMLVGNERYQFGFTSAIECVDSGNKFTSLRIGYGSLQHTQEPYINYANRGLWEISGATLTKDVNGADLETDTPYYLFAQVADDANPARLILTTDAHSSESEDDVPYLLLGILSSEFEDRRVFSRTNGYTAIEGGTITTEQIQDASRNLIIDFQSNPPRIIARNGAEIIGNVRFKASDTKTAEEQLRDLGIDVGNAQSTADDAKADAANAKSAADSAKSVADAATTRLNNWAADGVISPVEKQGIKDEIARIDADKSQITAEYTKYGLGTPTAFNTAHTNYRAVLVTLSANNPENIAIPADFSTKQTAYYTARTTALNAISTKADEVANAYADKVSASAAKAALDNLQIGGRNLVLNSDGSSTANIFAYGDCYAARVVKDYDGGTGNEIYIGKSKQPDAGYTYAQSVWIRAKQNLELDTDYVLSFDARLLSSSSFTSIPVYLRLAGTTYDTSVMKKVEVTKDLKRVSVVLHSYPTGPYNYGTLFIGVPTTIIYISKVKLEKGNKATDWTPAPEDVEASIAENKTYADGLVKALGDNLQNQIDGVVDSYFLEGKPTNSNYPANEWTTDDLKKRHEGDTYTNIQQYTKLEKDVWEQGSFAESQTDKEWVVNQVKYDINQKPIRLAELMENKKGNVVHLSDYSTYKFAVLYFNANKKMVVANFWKTADFVTADYPYIAISVTRVDNTQTSIADVVASGMVINPDAGKSWRWCKGTSDSPVTGWHWHEIADSDAVRALQNAAKAQDTADGKRRVFVVQPTPPYEIGDLWAQGDGDGKDILKCKTAKTAGQTFAQADWEAASSALTKAGQAATEAATAKANAQTALTTLGNIANDKMFTKQEKCAVRTEWASIQAEFTKNTNNAKVCWGESGYGNNTEYKAYSTAYTALNNYLTNTAKLSVNEDTEIKPDEFNKAFSDYYGANITLLNAIAKRVSELEVAAMSMGTRNLFAKRYMMDWNNKSAGTTTIGTDDYGDYYQIHENLLYQHIGGRDSYNDILQGKVSFEAGKQYCLKVKWRVRERRSGRNLLMIGFRYSDGTRGDVIKCNGDQLTPIEEFCVSNTNKTVDGLYCTYGTWDNLTRIYEIQLTEGNKAPSGWIEAEEDKETGGENLYTGDNPLTIKATTSNFNYVTLVRGLQNNARYIFSCGKSVVKASNTTQYAVLLYDFTNSTSQQHRLLPVGSTRVEQAFTIPSTGTWNMLIYSGVNGSTAGISMEYTDIMVQKGNKATEYQKPIRKFLYNGNVSIPYKNTDYAQSKLLASGVYAGTYYTEMASESKGAGVTTANREAFQNSCLVWFVAGKHQTTENVLKITDWGEAVNISQRADVYVYTGQAAFVKSHIQDPTSTGIEFTANGTWTISGAQISTYKMEYLDGEAYEAKTKAEALDYLKAAIANGSTEVAGGLLMTNVLMLRDLANKVTAGLSGLTKYKPAGSSITLEDLVLLWGGGTYDEAFYAARNAGYLKKAGGDPITTLLKKDGTGKIGIFKISDTQAVIDVPNQGKVIIDASTANGGIFIKDSGGIDRVVISPLSLNSFGVASTHDLGTAIILKNINENHDEDLSGTVSYSKSFTAGKSGTLESSFSVITDISASVSIERGKGYPSATSGYNSLTVSIKDTTNGTTVFTQSLSALSVTASANNTTNTNNYADSKTDGKTYPVSIKIQVIKGHNYTLSISGTAIVRTNAGGTPSQTYEVIVQSRLSITSNKAIKLLYADMCAYLCVDGMSVAANSELKFDVMKSGTNLKVLAQGLPTSKPGTKGQLWKSGDYLKIT